MALLDLFRTKKRTHRVASEVRPVFVATSRTEFEQGMNDRVFGQLRQLENELVSACTCAATTFTVKGFCVPCGKTVPLVVDIQFGGRCEGGVWIPNWRERLVCPVCKLNNRQRLIATLVLQQLGNCDRKQKVYFMEQVTPIYAWVTETLAEHEVIGSEYLGPDRSSGALVGGIRHEDVMHMGFGDSTLDLVVSNDVFEHVPNPEAAFRECYRVLRDGGAMLVTIPFHRDRDISVSRAEVRDGRTIHLLPPAYHGNPVSTEGSLVFTDFGWDVIESFQRAGFSDTLVEVYVSEEYGHLGGGQLIFRLAK